MELCFKSVIFSFSQQTIGRERLLKKLAAFLVSVLVISSFAFTVELARASGTIYIRADGSIDPSTAPIQRESDLHSLTDDIISDFGVH